MPSRAWIYDRNNPAGGGTTTGPLPPAPNLAAVSTVTLSYPVVGGLPKWNFTGTVTLPGSYGAIKFIHIIIPTLATAPTAPSQEVLTIPASKFGSADFPLAGLVLTYRTENQDLDTITWDYTAEFWVENADGVWTTSPPPLTTPVHVVGTAPPFGGGVAPIPPQIPALTAFATAYNVPYGNLWQLGFAITWTAPAGDYSVRGVKISPAARGSGGHPQQATIDTVQGPFTAGQACALTSDAVDVGQVIPETWIIRFIPINADQVAGPITDIFPIATPSTITAVSCSEVPGARTNIVPDDPSAASQRGLLTTIKFIVTLGANEGGTTWPQQVRAWLRYDRGSGAGVETILLGSFGVMGLGGPGLPGAAGEFTVPSVWVSIKNMAPGTFNTVKVICAIWASDSMPPPAENLGVNTGSFPMDPPAIKQPGSNTASVDLPIEYPQIPGGFGWRWHMITVTGVPFNQAEFKAIEFTVQLVKNTGDPNDPANAAPNQEGIERNFAGSGESETPFLNISVDYAAGIVKVTLLTIWTMPPKTNPDGSTNLYRRYIIRVKNSRQDDSKATVPCWPSGAGPGPAGEITYAVDRMEIVPDANKAGTITGALTLSFSGSDSNVGIPYNGAFLAVGGAQPYTFAIASGALPPGLNLSATGQITGAATDTGTFNFVGRVTDNATATAVTPTCTIKIGAAGTQVGLAIPAATVAVSYGSFGTGVINPIFSGNITMPAVSAPGYSSFASIWISVIEASNKSSVIAVLRGWAPGATTMGYVGNNAALVQSTADQTVSVSFQPTNTDGVTMGTPLVLTGVVIKGSTNATINSNQISAVSIAEVGVREQRPAGGNTYVKVQVSVTYAQSQTSVPVFTIWHSFDNGVTQKWFGWAQGKIGFNSSYVIEFFIPLGTSTYYAYVAPGTYNSTDAVPAFPTAIRSSNFLTLNIGTPSQTPGAGGTSILSAYNITGVAPSSDGSNIFMGSNSNGVPYALVNISIATPGQVDTAPYRYDVYIAWVNSSGALVQPGGNGNFFGWILAANLPNDGKLQIFTDQITYPLGDYYLQFEVWARARNSTPTNNKPTANDADTTAMLWPTAAPFGGLAYYRMHVGQPPGQVSPKAPTTLNNTNAGLSILSDPSFESTRPGQIMVGPSNAGPSGPGYMYPGWQVDCQSGTSIVTIMGTGGHSGSNFARLTGASTVIKQGFAIAPGLPIYVQFYMQSNTPSGGTHQLDITIFFVDSALVLKGQATVGTGVGTYASWSMVSLIIPASSVSAGAVQGILAFKTHFAEPSLGTWDIDDVVVQQVLQQVNSGQQQSMGSGSSIPVGPINTSQSTTATSSYQLDRVLLTAPDGSSSTVFCNTVGGSYVTVISPSPNAWGFQFAANPGGNSLNITQNGASKAGINTITFKDGNGVLRTFWNGILVV